MINKQRLMGALAICQLLLFCEMTRAADCNSNAFDDLLDITGGTSSDCNTNGIPDECDLVQIIQEAKVTASDPVALGFYGIWVAIDGDTAAIGTTGDDEGCGGSPMCNSGAVYVYVREGTTWSEQAKIIASDAGSNDAFGFRIALSGNTLLVSSHGDDDLGSQSGSVYVYTRSAGVWTEQTKLNADDGADNDNFGLATALDGDTAVIGAFREDEGAADAGSAYVFTRTDGVWSQQDKLIAADAGPSDEFGWAVAVHGDTAVIGAHFDDDAGGNSGSAYVFTRSGSTWSQQAKLVDTNGLGGDEFGWAVAVHGDTAVVGSYRDDEACATCNSGSAFVFTRTGTVWTEQAKIVPADAAADDEFGYSVDVHGDIALIGARLDANPSSLTGSVYVYERVGGSWDFIKKLKGNDTAGGDTFGQALAFDGDRAFISAMADDDVVINSGSAYVFDMAALDCNENGIPDECEADCNANGIADDCELAAGSANDCNLDGTLDVCELAAGSATDCNANDVPDSCDVFDLSSADCDGDDIPDECELAGGSSSDCNLDGEPDFCDVAPAYMLDKLLADDGAVSDGMGLDIDMDGDTVVVGAVGVDDGAIFSVGAAYVYVSTGAGWVQQAKLTASDAAAYDYFGTSVAIDGDTIVVGAYGDDDVHGSSGSAYVFVRVGDVWTEQAKLTAGDPAFQSYFGYDVAIDGETALIGARGNSMGANAAGEAYVYVRSGSVWTQQQKLTASDAESEDEFGWSVGLSGDTAVIGAYSDNDWGANTGSAYIFERSGTVWTESAKILGFESDHNDRFGISVAIDGDWVVVGAYNDQSYDAGTVLTGGAAYVFARDGGAWSQEARLIPDDLNYSVFFGWSVSIKDETIAVGAYGDDDACPTETSCNSGAAYVFVRTAGNWRQRSKLGVGIAVEDDYFGRSVAISEGKVAIGAGRDDESAENAGAGYVFDLQDSADCNANGNPDECDIASALSMDCNSNGIPDECETDCNANGVPDDCDIADLTSADCDADGILDECGFVPGTYLDCNANSIPDVCDISGGTSDDCNTNALPDECDLAGTMLQQSKLIADDIYHSLTMSEAIAISGDTLVAGTGSERIGPYNNSGAIYIFDRIDGVWTQTVKIPNPAPASDDGFGQSVAILGDTIIVGAHSKDIAALSAGAAYVYVRSAGVWTLDSVLTADDATNGDQFGWSIAMQDDTALIGAVTDDPTATNSGSVYVFERSGGVWSQEAKFFAADGAENDTFGFSISLDGDTAIIGAPQNYPDPGAAYVYVRSGGVWTQQDKLLADDGAAWDLFGQAVTVSGDTAVIGSPYDDDLGDYSGSVYVFNRSGSVWTQVDKLLSSDSSEQDFFGITVTMRDDVLFVGAARNDTICTDCDNGSAYLFKRSAGVWTEQQTIVAADASTNALFGYAIAIDGNSVAIGALSDDEIKPQAGAAYVFELPSEDCNYNTVPDACDIAVLTSDDCDTNGVPDECDPDCDTNGVPDTCDIALGDLIDCNGNGIPNICENPDLDLSDYAAFTICITDPTPECLALFDLAEPCGVLDLADFEAFATAMTGPIILP